MSPCMISSVEAHILSSKCLAPDLASVVKKSNSSTSSFSFHASARFPRLSLYSSTSLSVSQDVRPDLIWTLTHLFSVSPSPSNLYYLSPRQLQDPESFRCLRICPEKLPFFTALDTASTIKKSPGDRMRYVFFGDQQSFLFLKASCVTW